MKKADTPHGWSIAEDSGDSPWKVYIDGLFDRGADVNARSDRGYSPLLVGAQYQGSDAAIRLLLDRGAKVNASPDEKVDANAFPVFFAAHVGNAGLIPVLRRAGANIEGRTVMFGGGDEVSALDVAAMYGHDETARSAS